MIALPRFGRTVGARRGFPFGSRIGYPDSTMADISRDGHSPALGDLYVVQELIGEGPTGCVFKATDRDLRRTVALKLLAADDPREVARLQRVAKAQARLGHEHVCRIYDVGEIDGRAYVAMQFIDGRPLRSMVSELDMLEKAELVEGVARGVQAAHTAGLLHRDLKPSNIMVERRSDGRLHPSVIDFGVTAGTGATADPRLGTPSFMAPEQLRGEAAAIDHLTDVYGLGATLFAVLAEQVPFFGPTRADTVRQVLDEQPLPLGLVVPGTPRDLETIAAVAMAKDPAQRYPSAGAFADDLRHWLDGEPIRARSDGPLYRLGARLRTGWVSAAVLASVVTFSTMAAASVVWLRYRDGRRTVLTASYEHEVWQMDRLLRQARMMPLHDTSEAEHEVRSRLAAVRETLLADGFEIMGKAISVDGGHPL